jgi:hypothetical protein
MRRLQAINAGSEWELKEHDRWLTARDLSNRTRRGRRSTTRLGELIDLVVARPLISVGLVAKELKMIVVNETSLLVSHLGAKDQRRPEGRSQPLARSLYGP